MSGSPCDIKSDFTITAKRYSCSDLTYAHFFYYLIYLNVMHNKMNDRDYEVASGLIYS
jgi:hypothetical protein